jgi:hypothetical protein
MDKNYLFVSALGLLVVFLIVSGVGISGNPFLNRYKELDKKKVDAITQLKYKIENYAYSNRELPNNLRDLPGVTDKDLFDSDTNSYYAYHKTSPSTYSICATFHLDSSQGTNTYYGPETYHQKGYSCINFTLPYGYLPTPFFTPTPTQPPVSITPKFTGTQLCFVNGGICTEGQACGPGTVASPLRSDTINCIERNGTGSYCCRPADGTTYHWGACNVKYNGLCKTSCEFGEISVANKDALDDCAVNSPGNSLCCTADDKAQIYY